MRQQASGLQAEFLCQRGQHRLVGGGRNQLIDPAKRGRQLHECSIEGIPFGFPLCRPLGSSFGPSLGLPGSKSPLFHLVQNLAYGNASFFPDLGWIPYFLKNILC